MRPSFALILALLANLGAARYAFAADVAPQAADHEFFEKRIRPIFVTHCYECHSAASKKLGGNLRLDTRSGILRGGDTGPALIPRDPKQSLLLTAVRYDDDSLQMPPAGKLPAEAIAGSATAQSTRVPTNPPHRPPQQCPTGNKHSPPAAIGGAYNQSKTHRSRLHRQSPARTRSIASSPPDSKKTRSSSPRRPMPARSSVASVSSSPASPLRLPMSQSSPPRTIPQSRLPTLRQQVVSRIAKEFTRP
jgi:mono/diheme cytochrome c family protein